MRSSRTIAVLFLLVSIGQITPMNAQDVQLSQQDLMPLFLNPAWAGAFNDKQALLIYRQQQVASAEPFRTMGASFDFCLNPITPERTEQTGRLGLGLGIMKDRSGSPAFRTTDLQVNLAYQLFIDGYSSFGAGIQMGVRQQAVDPLEGSWASQFNGQNYDASIPHGEQFQTESRTRPDVGAGLIYSFKRMPQPRKRSNTLEAQAGAAIFHAGRPDLSVLEGDQHRLERRYSGFVEASIGVGRSNLVMEPAAYLHMQGGSSELMAGLAVRRTFGGKGGFLDPERDVSMALGIFCRNGRAVVATLEMEWSNYAIGMAYDMNLISTGRIAPLNAMEFGLRYRIPAAKGPKRGTVG